MVEGRRIEGKIAGAERTGGTLTRENHEGSEKWRQYQSIAHGQKHVNVHACASLAALSLLEPVPSSKDLAAHLQPPGRKMRRATLGGIAMATAPR